MKIKIMKMLNKTVPTIYMNKISIIITLKMKEKKSKGELQIEKKEKSLSVQSI
jgi:PBP1b-binding outer membrane lipoprotein LpoB